MLATADADCRQGQENRRECFIVPLRDPEGNGKSLAWINNVLGWPGRKVVQQRLQLVWQMGVARGAVERRRPGRHSLARLSTTP